MENSQPYVVPVREIGEDKMMSTLELLKGIKQNEPTYLATLKIEEGSKDGGIDISNLIQVMFDGFKDVMLVELLKKLPSKREVDHTI